MKCVSLVTFEFVGREYALGFIICFRLKFSKHSQYNNILKYKIYIIEFNIFVYIYISHTFFLLLEGNEYQQNVLYYRQKNAGPKWFICS